MDEPERNLAATSRSWGTELLNWCLLLLVGSLAGYFAWHLPAERQRFLRIYEDFEMEIPALSLQVFAIPGFAYPLLAAATVGVAVVLMMILENRSIVTACYALAIIGWLAIVATFYFAMMMPMDRLLLRGG